MTAGFLVGPREGNAMWSIGGRFTRKVGGSDSAPSRILVITSPSVFEGSIADLGVPATADDPPADLSLPPRAVILPVAERYGIEIVGPTIRAGVS